MVSFAPKLVVVESRRDLFNAAIKGTRGNFQLEKREKFILRIMMEIMIGGEVCDESSFRFTMIDFVISFQCSVFASLSSFRFRRASDVSGGTFCRSISIAVTRRAQN